MCKYESHTHCIGRGNSQWILKFVNEQYVSSCKRTTFLHYLANINEFLLLLINIHVFVNPHTKWREYFPYQSDLFYKLKKLQLLVCLFFAIVGQKGFDVYKSVPYGPVGEVLAYLGRRAAENRDVMKRTEKERSLLWKELRRRITFPAH